ncbi:MAG TPA: HAMP domain-containing sensor histidine kinase [Nocardioides sp.]|uniref:sensor histidine kinase n=1 Tax=uncultured Nocardioides sp. TaxID=198441 RepID=UPI000ED2CA54|nr:HAMP domain-containing sensor histidine kinase [uncultured Nocardioides sp.]HCB02804.1 two-component sensor histidine kinase [Nocardioides sp.]HRI94955.1 HAMP domain-containing sensor histidine kinase [Nocardioides sp.]
MRNAFASLTSRLVLTVVALVVLVAVLIGGAAIAALNAQLNRQIDDDLHRLAQRPIFIEGSQPDFPSGGGGPGPGNGGSEGAGPQSLLVTFEDGQVVSAQMLGFGPGNTVQLSDDAVAELRDVPADDHVHQVDLPGFGTYRVIMRTSGDQSQVVGLPTDRNDEAVTTLIGWEALLIVLGALVAAGGGLLLVRRQLRPLTEVAATAHRVADLPLAEGEIDLTERVPEHLTDERTEVGQVGAALNTLLEHVETSLEARHRSEQQVRQFVADASHELRTPLATIAGYTELARRRPDDGIVETALGKVEEETVRMTSLVEDLLLLARLDAGRPLEREPVDLTRLLLEAVSDARVLAPDHQWRLQLPEAPLEVVGDEQRLHQVVTNLLTNARKHTPPGTTVTVTGRADGFDVHDDGPGFPPEFVDHAFERFARLDEARERSTVQGGGGAGLGLSMVQAIVASHGGTVALTSAPSSTTIAVRLG